jgi:DNA replication licensing factor MCM5
MERSFWEFLYNFRIGNEFAYRDRLRSSLLLGKHTLQVDLDHLLMWNEQLGQRVMERPGECVPLLESALLRLSRQILHPLSRSGQQGLANGGNAPAGAANGNGNVGLNGDSAGVSGLGGQGLDAGELEIPDVQVTIRSSQDMLQFRDLTVRNSFFRPRSHLLMQSRLCRRIHCQNSSGYPVSSSTHPNCLRVHRPCTSSARVAETQRL